MQLESSHPGASHIRPAGPEQSETVQYPTVSSLDFESLELYIIMWPWSGSLGRNIESYSSPLDSSPLESSTSSTSSNALFLVFCSFAFVAYSAGWVGTASFFSTEDSFAWRDGAVTARPARVIRGGEGREDEAWHNVVMML